MGRNGGSEEIGTQKKPVVGAPVAHVHRYREVGSVGVKNGSGRICWAMGREDITHVNEETDKNLRLINDVELNATQTHHHMTSSRERHVATWKCGQQVSVVKPVGQLCEQERV